jgi:serine protease Do
MCFNSLRAALLAAVLMAVAGLPTAPPAAAAGPYDPGLPNLVATLLPSVVNITTWRYEALKIPPGQAAIAQAAKPDRSVWYGTGFIVSTDGYVVTNKHVVHNGFKFKVTLSDGSQLPAELIAEATCCDVAVIKIQAVRPFPPVKLGDSDTLRQGDFVIAIGNPLDFNSTVTTGIISALNRDFHFTEFDDYIQTDAAINEGNSGGPMFNADGQVVAVNSALYTAAGSTGNIGIGLAIPINDAKAIVANMRDIYMHGSARPGYLGMQVQSLTSDLADAYGIHGPWGSIILSVIDGSPAAKADLRPGDIVTAFGNKFTADDRALRRAIVETRPGTEVNLLVLRDGQQQMVPVTVAALPPGQSYGTFLGAPGAPKPQLPPEAAVNFGLQTATITPELRAQYHLSDQQQGVVITGVAIGSPAANGKINAGSVIVRVRNTPVNSPNGVTQAVEKERSDRQTFVPIMLLDPSGLRWVALPLS